MDFEDAELVGLIRQCIPVGVARYFEQLVVRARPIAADACRRAWDTEEKGAFALASWERGALP